MPSDCQCSNACQTEYIERKVVLGNKEATRKLRKLEREVEELKAQNSLLRRELKTAKISKKKIVGDLKRHLDRA
jgi:hypothetical protein